MWNRSHAASGVVLLALVFGCSKPPDAELKTPIADAQGVTLDHGPVPALKWPAMTMTFRLGDPVLERGFKAGDRVRFGFDQPPEGPTLRRMTRETGQ